MGNALKHFAGGGDATDAPEAPATGSPAPSAAADPRLVVGARVRKKFPGNGDFDGEVVGVEVERFTVRWSDGAEHSYRVESARAMLESALRAPKAPPRGVKRGREAPVATLNVRGCYLRPPDAAGPVFARERARGSVMVGPAGMQGSEEWARANAGRLANKDVLDRAVLLQFEENYDAARAFAATSSSLRAPLPDASGGAWGENVYASGASASTLCVGDVLEVTDARAPNSLRLQIASSRPGRYPRSSYRG